MAILRFTAGRVLVLLLFASPCPLPAQRGDVPPRVEIPNTELLHLTSATVGQEYDLYVSLPGNYGDTGRSYPVVYVLDAQWDFPLVTAIYGQQYYDGFIPAVLVVGITWGGTSPNPDSLRARDLTPTHNTELPQSGGAAKFLSFIKTELIPMIDARYRTVKNDRTLMGSSFGGLFGLYALFQETGLFNRYALTSPAVSWDGGSISSFEKEYAAARSQIPVRLFIAEGELEQGADEFKKFAAQLTLPHYPGLDLRTQIVEGMGHSGSKAEGYTRGLQAVFERPSLDVADEVLRRYAGVYELRPGATVTLNVEAGHLVAQTSMGEQMVLQSASTREFYVRGQFLIARFDPDSTGAVSGFRLERYGGEQFIRRIK